MGFFRTLARVSVGAVGGTIGAAVGGPVGAAVGFVVGASVVPGSAARTSTRVCREEQQRMAREYERRLMAGWASSPMNPNSPISRARSMQQATHKRIHRNFHRPHR